MLKSCERVLKPTAFSSICGSSAGKWSLLCLRLSPGAFEPPKAVPEHWLAVVGTGGTISRRNPGLLRGPCDAGGNGFCAIRVSTCRAVSPAYDRVFRREVFSMPGWLIPLGYRLRRYGGIQRGRVSGRAGAGRVERKAPAKLSNMRLWSRSNARRRGGPTYEIHSGS